MVRINGKEIKVEKIVGYSYQLPRCDARVEPNNWNGNEGQCINKGKLKINGRCLCRKHAGAYLIALALGEPWTDTITGVRK